jgi:KDO2-lipid IV(A) lauroyltransferase
MEVLPLTGGDRDVLRASRPTRAHGRAVCLLADRDLTAGGVPVTFFGEPARMPGGPALLSLLTGGRLHPVISTYDGPMMVLRICDPVPAPDSGTTREKVQAMMQAVAEVFEAAIRERPQDWHMLQQMWPADVDPATRG